MNKRKIGIALSSICLIIAIGGSLYVNNFLTQNSSQLGDPILIVKEDLAEGTIVKGYEDLDNYFTVKKIPKNQQVKNAIKVKTKENKGFKKLFNFNSDKLTIDDNFKDYLVNKKITNTLLENEQVSSNWISNDTVDFKENERIFNITVDLHSSCGGEVNVGDYVDVWTNNKISNNPKKIAGPFKILKIKNSENVEGNSKQRVIPNIVILKCSEEQIKELSKVNSEQLFLTKYGINPNKYMSKDK